LQGDFLSKYWLRAFQYIDVDIFYSHRPDPDTPLEETMGALDQIVRQGKALYVGISNYSAEQTKEAV
jgi:L-glyceraldehyde 3-phosphate reductase